MISPLTLSYTCVLHEALPLSYKVDPLGSTQVLVFNNINNNPRCNLCIYMLFI